MKPIIFLFVYLIFLLLARGAISDDAWHPVPDLQDKFITGIVQLTVNLMNEDPGFGIKLINVEKCEFQDTVDGRYYHFFFNAIQSRTNIMHTFEGSVLKELNGHLRVMWFKWDKTRLIR
ncbi:unnamed protein product [Linum trigynum]|uniref:Cystatin domain-containing protein n=1 Tax=Linum trigynum TaxID=586398 RepID=A0AAV2D0N6_9ROSI